MKLLLRTVSLASLTALCLLGVSGTPAPPALPRTGSRCPRSVTACPIEGGVAS
jgi:hypothetical protein